MSDERKTVAGELGRYPTTGRFLAGRLRYEMSGPEKAKLEGLVERVDWIEANTRLLQSGNVYHYSTILIEGFVLRTLDGENQRHAVSFHVPGDFVDLHCFALKRLDHNIDTVGKAKVGLVPHSALNKVMETDPHLARILWFSTLLDAAMHREWIMKLEQLKAPRRIAHIFAEINHRLELIGLGAADGFDSELRQSELAEMTGTTTIHVNRALRELRESKIATFERGRVIIHDRTRLEEYGAFDPAYLYSDGLVSFQDKAADGG